jgi:leucyl-tRNA synthetase
MSQNPPSAPAQPGDSPAFRYTAHLAGSIESKWQDHWDAHQTYRTSNPGEPGFDASKPKKFILDMFPYPSGAGLHVGHPLGFIATDIYARYLRMTGHNVLHAMGYDSFGLPAEQYAIATNTHPRVTTDKNIANMRRQMRLLGLGHDGHRSISTTDPQYYKWTQWIFLQIYNAWYDEKLDRARPIKELEQEFISGQRKVPGHDKPFLQLPERVRRDAIDAHRLAYLAEVPVNWCPMLGTVLANEEVIDGKSERGNFPVYKRPLRQWMMRITAYNERLLRDLLPLDWPEAIKLMQRNWIGKSEGAHIDFDSGKRRVRVFTTRPDTLFGATYMVLAPEHEMVDDLLSEKYGEVSFVKAKFPGADELIASGATPKQVVEAYRAFARSKTDEQRQQAGAAKDKTGVFIGAYAINPVNNARLPIFIADYVLTGYGTGAIMAVPGHDQRDFDFAYAFDLPIEFVVRPESGEFVEPGYCLDFGLNVVPGELVDTCATEYDIRSPRVLTNGCYSKLYFKSNRQARRFVNERVPHLEPEISKHLVAMKAFENDGVACNSTGLNGFTIDGLTTAEAKKKITTYITNMHRGKVHVTYKLRDWLFSRQRYWGEPFPVLHDELGNTYALREDQLPLLLPEMDNFQPEASADPDAPPRPPLARAKEWMTVRADMNDGRGERTFTREANTMPNWAGSCWYYLRYLDPDNAHNMVAPSVEKYWMLSKKSNGENHIGGVDLYVGGVEHAVLHLLYARFWHKVLFDLGHVSTPEPFGKLFNQGYIQAFAYTDERGFYVPAEEVKLADGTLAMENQASNGPFFHEGKPVKREYGKMGKSLKNAVAPDDVCAQYGCDTLRVYEMSMGPLEASKPWNTRDIAGAYRFLQRVWRNLVDENTGALRVTSDAASPELLRSLHKTIAGVRKDMATLGFNTVVAKLIELNNELTKAHGPDAKSTGVPREIAEPLVLMLAPLAPHMGEELWAKLGHATSVVYAPYPVADEKLAADDQIEIPVQVLGKLRGRITVPAGADAKALEAAALACEDVKPHIEGKSIKKVIVVPGKMVNLVVG